MELSLTVVLYYPYLSFCHSSVVKVLALLRPRNQTGCTFPCMYRQPGSQASPFSCDSACLPSRAAYPTAPLL